MSFLAETLYLLAALLARIYRPSKCYTSVLFERNILLHKCLNGTSVLQWNFGLHSILTALAHFAPQVDSQQFVHVCRAYNDPKILSMFYMYMRWGLSATQNSTAARFCRLDTYGLSWEHYNIITSNKNKKNYKNNCV